MFGDLFAAALDWWAKCCPDMSSNDSWDIIDAQPSWIGGNQMYEVLRITSTVQTLTLISMMKRIPKCFVTSAEDCRDISYDNTYHDRNFAFSALVYLQGWDSLDLMYQVEVGSHSFNTQAAVNAAMIAFRMQNGQVTNFKGIHDAMMEGTCQDLGTVVSIEIDALFVCDQDS
ncbi:hypothetical protein BHYA_0040g00210 [Botrytis hyacinthi]|uniref:Uncharacterized protein n=1 Tax=Botrytis hyacinthi TaxID=278943 RepID=A0A4Z1H4L4_9HELO|nr:hypothetical protein BHYA_0040g00210 [Botrytis hyacinthi]